MSLLAVKFMLFFSSSDILSILKQNIAILQTEETHSPAVCRVNSRQVPKILWQYVERTASEAMKSKSSRVLILDLLILTQLCVWGF